MNDLALTYTELKAKLAEALGVVEVKASTLSRWMSALGVETRSQNPGRSFYDMEELFGLYIYGSSMRRGLRGQIAIDLTVQRIQEFRRCQSIPTNLITALRGKASANM